jgi:hypothetical protein
MLVDLFYRYESSENMTITCSTKVCSFGKQVVEKVEVRLSYIFIYSWPQLWSVINSSVNCFILQTEYAHFENGRFVYRIHRSPMCEYMINFIQTQTTSGEIHDEQCAGKLYHSTGGCLILSQRRDIQRGNWHSITWIFVSRVPRATLNLPASAVAEIS